jgi:hypothetical protein
VEDIAGDRTQTYEPGDVLEPSEREAKP